MRHIRVNGILDRALSKHLLTKYQIFTILTQISHIHKNRIFKNMIEKK